MATSVSSSPTPPAGFDTVSKAEFPPNWEWDKNDTLTGGVCYKKIAEIQRGKDVEQVPVMVIAAGGLEFTVWQSAGLSDLISKAEPGDAVFIYYTGDIPLKHRKDPMRGFDCYIKKGGGHEYIREAEDRKAQEAGTKTANKVPEVATKSS